MSWCDAMGAWHKENWRYASMEAAQNWLEVMVKVWEGAVIEQVDPEWQSEMEIDRGPMYVDEDGRMRGGREYAYNGAYCLEQDPWNWQQRDWLKGVRVREKARKRIKLEP